MAIQFLPAIIAAARTVAVAGRAAFATAGRGAATAGRYGRWSWMVGGRRRQQEEQRPTHDEAIRNVRTFYANARRQLGTPNPTMQQYSDVARQQRDEQEQRQEEQVHRETRERLMALGKVAGLTAAGFAGMRVAMRDYTSEVTRRGDQLRQFDSRIGLAMARSDVGDLLRTYRTAGDVSATTSALLDARRQKADDWQPVNAQMENFGNAAKVWGTRAQAWVGRLLDQIKVDDALKAVNQKLDKWLGIVEKKNDDAPQALARAYLREHGRMPQNRGPDEPGGVGGFGGGLPGGGGAGGDF